MRASILDPTAGEKARALRAHPGTPYPISDPTDVRYGDLPVGRDGVADPRHVFDPTDPECDRR